MSSQTCAGVHRATGGLVCITLSNDYFVVVTCNVSSSSQHFLAIQSYSQKLGMAEQNKNAEVMCVSWACCMEVHCKGSNECVVNCQIKAVQMCACVCTCVLTHYS